MKKKIITFFIIISFIIVIIIFSINTKLITIKRDVFKIVGKDSFVNIYSDDNINANLLIKPSSISTDDINNLINYVENHWLYKKSNTCDILYSYSEPGLPINEKFKITNYSNITGESFEQMCFMTLTYNRNFDKEINSITYIELVFSVENFEFNENMDFLRFFPNLKKLILVFTDVESDDYENFDEILEKIKVLIPDDCEIEIIS